MGCKNNAHSIIPTPILFIHKILLLLYAKGKCLIARMVSYPADHA